ncbi:MAG: class I SAM-dependent methyltransferase [Elusimicrobia bacterium]|nr:class I SAM-dependent methyltransferase [Elusimicrobiota bacterium]
MARPESDPEYARVFTEGYLLHTREKEVLASRLRRLLRGVRCGRALDIGPGDGKATQVLAEHAREIVAVEPQARFAEALARRLPRARVLRTTVQRAKFRPRSFDLILASHMLYYIPLDGWERFLETALGWLKPGGRLVVVMSAGDSGWFKSVAELSALLKVSPNFSYTAPEEFFKTAAGGADKLLRYSAPFRFRGTRKQLEYFLVELELLVPYRMMSAAQRRRVARYVRSRWRGARGYEQDNRYVVGVWRR